MRRNMGVYGRGHEPKRGVQLLRAPVSMPYEQASCIPRIWFLRASPVIIILNITQAYMSRNMIKYLKYSWVALEQHHYLVLSILGLHSEYTSTYIQGNDQQAYDYSLASRRHGDRLKNTSEEVKRRWEMQ